MEKLCNIENCALQLQQDADKPNGYAYHVCSKTDRGYVPVRATTFNEVMDITIDLLGKQRMTATVFNQCIEATQEKTGKKQLISFFYAEPTENNDHRVCMDIFSMEDGKPVRVLSQTLNQYLQNSILAEI